jgi:hypothetical protein
LFYINKEGIVKDSRDNISICITSKYKWDIYMAYYHVSIICSLQASYDRTIDRRGVRMFKITETIYCIVLDFVCLTPFEFLCLFCVSST